MPVKPPKKLRISGRQLKGLQKRIKDRKLQDADYEMLQGFAETVECLSQTLAEKDTSIGRLCKYLLGTPTETARNILGRDKKGEEKPETTATASEDKVPSKPKPKGHGRKPVSAYEDGSKITIEHPELTSGDRCPGCDKGKLYELDMPSVFVHIKGGAPLKATVYERTRLRCNLCGEILTPQLPEDVGNKKHDESVYDRQPACR
jgi:hypothetical protein